MSSTNCTSSAPVILCVLVINMFFFLLVENSSIAGLRGHFSTSRALDNEPSFEEKLEELRTSILGATSQGFEDISNKMEEMNNSLNAVTDAVSTNSNIMSPASPNNQDTKETTDLIFVLGAGHSGTSIAAGLLSVSGAEMPFVSNNKESHKANASSRTHPKGIFESTSVSRLNENIMKVMGITMKGPPSQYRKTVHPEDYPDVLAKVRQTLIDSKSQIGHGKAILFKDPRFSYTMPFWSKAAASLDQHYNPVMVVSHRHPVPTCNHNTCPNCGAGVDCFDRVRAILRAIRHNCQNDRLVVFDLNRFQSDPVGTYQQYIKSLRNLGVTDLTDATTEQLESVTAKRQDVIPDDFNKVGYTYKNFLVTQELLDELDVYETIGTSGCGKSPKKLCGDAVSL